MTIAPPAAVSTAPEADHTALAPLLLPHDLRLTPEQFALVCEANPDAVLELAADGQLITMTPTGGETGARNINFAYQLSHWARSHGSWKLFDSSTGFRLADGSVLSPDLVIELASASDSGPRGADALRRKMGLYQANGAQLGWLLFPEQRAVEIWPARPEAGAASAPHRLENATRLEGGAVLPGLVLELEEIWAA